MKYNKLGGTDMMVSQLGFGSSAIRGVYSAVDEQEVSRVVSAAFQGGINYVDTAPWYGTAETVIGKVLSSVPRSSYYIATKVGRYDLDTKRMFDFSAERTLQSVDESLCKIRCGYFDIVQVHDVEFAPSIDVILNETLPALEKAKEAGKIRYIGITGYPLDVLEKIVERSRVKIDTVLSYCRCCLHDTSFRSYAQQLKAKGIGVIDAAGLGMGLYASSRSLPSWHPAPTEIRVACDEADAFCRENGVSLSKLAVHFNLSCEEADTHLISCAQTELMRDNLDVCVNGLNSKEKKVLDEITNKFFKPLQVRNWEGVELDKYWKKMNAI